MAQCANFTQERLIMPIPQSLANQMINMIKTENWVGLSQLNSQLRANVTDNDPLCKAFEALTNLIPYLSEEDLLPAVVRTGHEEILELFLEADCKVGLDYKLILVTANATIEDKQATNMVKRLIRANVDPFVEDPDTEMPLIFSVLHKLAIVDVITKHSLTKHGEEACRILFGPPITRSKTLVHIQKIFEQGPQLVEVLQPVLDVDHYGIYTALLNALKNKTISANTLMKVPSELLERMFHVGHLPAYYSPIQGENWKQCPYFLIFFVLYMKGSSRYRIERSIFTPFITGTYKTTDLNTENVQNYLDLITKSLILLRSIRDKNFDELLALSKETLSIANITINNSAISENIVNAFRDNIDPIKLANVLLDFQKNMKWQLCSEAKAFIKKSYSNRPEYIQVRNALRFLLHTDSSLILIGEVFLGRYAETTAFKGVEDKFCFEQDPEFIDVSLSQFIAILRLNLKSLRDCIHTLELDPVNGDLTSEIDILLKIKPETPPFGMTRFPLSEDKVNQLQVIWLNVQKLQLGLLNQHLEKASLMGHANDELLHPAIPSQFLVDQDTISSQPVRFFSSTASTTSTEITSTTPTTRKRSNQDDDDNDEFDESVQGKRAKHNS